MEKDQLKFTQITDKTLNKVEHHLYKIETTRGIFHLSYREALSLLDQLKINFGEIKDEEDRNNTEKHAIN